MIESKNENQIELMRIAGTILGETLQLLKQHVKPGVTTKQLDNLAYEFILSKGGFPTCLNYEGFPASICTSVNNVVVHGIPSDYVLKNGDIVGLDIVVGYKGYQADACRTFCCGQVSPKVKQLVEVTKQCFFESIKDLKSGDRVGKISNAVETYAHKFNCGVVKELVGHGIGRKMHQDPQVPNYGRADSGEILPNNCTLAIEPMINMGTAKIYLLDDDWTIITADGKPSAHYENTVLITNEGVEILTLMPEEKEDGK